MATERKEKLIRVLQILDKTDVKTPVNAKAICDKLENEYHVGYVERRSIYRDIALLQACGYSIIAAKDRRNGWYMKNHAFEDWEIKIMMDTAKQARCISEKEANDIEEKLLRLTSERGRSRFAQMITPSSGNIKTESGIGEYIERMLEARYLQKKIQFQYTEINDKMEKVLRKEGKIYTLSLYSIYWSNNNYYLIGSHDNHEGLTNYRLDRIVNLSISEEDMIPAEEKIGENPEEYIQNYINKSVNHFSGETIKVVLEYDPDPVTNAILYDFAGDEVKVKKTGEDKLEASFYKLNSVTLTGWLLQYGDRFTVKEPMELKEAVRKKLNNICKKYEM